ncbi:MAG: ribonuclease J [Chthonomonas sp.]|nr:ribonuclease J [Chthonomonas sp.]
MPDVHIVPLGGASEIGKNCTCVIQGDDMVVVDVGLSFPNEEMHGVDIVIPDFQFILENKHKLRAIFLTHAHEDHIGALPYLLEKVECPVYSTQFTLSMVRRKLEERLEVKPNMLIPMKPGDVVTCGSLSVEPIRVTHSIPDTMALAIKTQHGYVLFTADFKFDFSPIDQKLSDLSRLAQIGDEGVVCLVSDSTNIERSGWSPSESLVANGFRKIFAQSEGRVLITSFASNIHRMQQAFTVAAELGRKVAVAGRRMEQTVDLCIRGEYLKIPYGTQIKLEDVGKYEPHELVILTTGSQGEPMSALVQMSREEYSRLKIIPGDTVIYSARPIPGNEGAIWRTVNRLFRMGATVIYDDPGSPVHVSGHGYLEELKMMVNLTRPYYLTPVHGEPRHIHLYRKMALAMGYPDHRIFTMEDGLPVVIGEESAAYGEAVPCGRVLVDNGGNAGISDEILRDRSNLANEGIVVITVAIDVEQGDIVGDITLQAKGYSGPETVLMPTCEVVYDALRELKKSEMQDLDVVRHTVADAARRFLGRRTKMRPLVIPAIVEV